MAGSPEKPAFNKPALITGRQPVIEAIESGRVIEKILLQAGVTGDTIGKIRALARDRQIPVQVVPPEKLSALTRAAHQGVIAIASLVAYQDLQQVIAQVVESGVTPLFVMLDGITDVRNIGGIARTAVCCGSQALVIADKGVGALNEEAIKASAGALEKIRICRVGSLLKAIDDMHLHGFKVFVSEMTADDTLQAVDFTVPSCIVLGSEGRGVQPYISKSADVRFRIPMSGEFDSFNVSVATGIILYEAMKQRL